jgi:hypothetical protein
LPLRIRPVKLKQSVYLRVPVNIAGLVEIDPNSQATLHVKEQEERFLLIYSVEKSQGRDQSEFTSSMQILERSQTSKHENK